MYSYVYSPKKAMRFLISGQSVVCKQSEKCRHTKDLVGEEIRTKIKDIGALWRKSPNNRKIKDEVLRKWDDLIEKWIVDENMPLIVRKETNKRGQSFVHPCGREIVVSDNTVAIWVYKNALQGKVFTLSQIKELLSQNELPMVFMTTNEIRAKAKYTKPLGRYAMPGWKLCHIKPVGFNTNISIEGLKISDIEDHFRKYINPNNMFVLPKEIGCLGEIDAFIEEQSQKI